MKRLCAVVLALFVCVCVFAACGEQKTYQDGVYTAEFEEYDAYGYRDFLRATVREGVIVELVFNGVNADGLLKTEDANYQARMSLVNTTYPKRYTADLVNQYMADRNIDEVSVVAGATWSSECFKALFKALEERMQAGDTTVIRVENIPEI